LENAFPIIGNIGRGGGLEKWGMSEIFWFESLCQKRGVVDVDFVGNKDVGTIEINEIKIKIVWKIIELLDSIEKY